MIKQILIFPIKCYQWFISPLLGQNCRYQPSCSNYMIQALTEWGAVKGLFMGTKRICRCHPWGGHGPDPVPLNPKLKKNIDATKTSQK